MQIFIRAAIVAAAALLLVLTTRASRAHEFYDPWCCNESDCAPYHGVVEPRAGGFFLPAFDVLIPYRAGPLRRAIARRASVSPVRISEGHGALLLRQGGRRLMGPHPEEARRAVAKDLFAQKAPALMLKLQADFGLSVEETAAVLGNLGHECGGFRQLQELVPTVPGSRGGYGWAQWTGPRRRQFEAYCRRNGFQPHSDLANYGFLFVELRGPEKQALAALKAARGLRGKVVAFEIRLPARRRQALRQPGAVGRAGAASLRRRPDPSTSAAA